MKKKTTKRRCVLLDANVIIEAHRLGVWEAMVDGLRLTIPSTVVSEAKYYWGTEDWPTDLDLRGLIQCGKITQKPAAAADLQSVHACFDDAFIDSIDAGEAEALALLISGKVEGHLFCTADGPAIEALAMLGFGHLGISFESLLRQIGHTLPAKARRQWRDPFFREHLTQGRRKRVTREGLRTNGWS